MTFPAGSLIMQVLNLCSLFVTVFFPVASFVLEPDLTWDACQLPEEFRSTNGNWSQLPCKDLVEVQKYYMWCGSNRCNDSDLDHAVCDEFIIIQNSERSGPLLSAFAQQHPLKLDANFFANVSGDQRVTGLVMTKIYPLIVENGSMIRLKHLVCLNLDGSYLPEPLDALKEILKLPKLERLSLRDVFWGKQNDVQDIFSQIPWSITKSVRSLWLSNSVMGGICSLVQSPFYMKESGLTYHSNKHVSLLGPVTIEVLDLSTNAIKTLIETCDFDFRPLYPLLKKLNLSNNLIETYMPTSSGSFCLSNLTELDLSHNLILFIEPYYSQNGSLPSLTILYLSYQKTTQQVTIGDRAFCNPTTLAELHIDNSNLDFAGANENGDFVSKLFLKDCSDLQRLSLEGCHLQALDEDSFVEYFGYLVSLQYLNMARTGLGFMSPKAFSVLGNLTRLVLHSNAITHVPDGCFDTLQKLQKLDLSNNKIPVISELTFGPPLRRQLNSLQLHENPFVCSCNLLWFTRWLASNSGLFVRRGPRTNSSLKAYRCSGQPKKDLSDLTLTDQACLLSRETSIMIILTTVIFILTFTGSLLAFSYRWHLRLLFYQAFRGPGDVRRRHLQRGTFMYDVFVSYASENLPWVCEQLMPELEDRLGLRLCLHQRNFIPGQDIVDNIVDNVASSKKIVMAFSNHFVKSQWCQFELSFCLSHVMDVEDALIVLCLDDVASRDMTSAMMAVLKTTTYLQWAEEREAVAAFWGRLRQAFWEILNERELTV